MSTWEELLGSNPVWISLQNVGPALEDAQTIATDDNQRGTLSRARHVVGYVQTRLASLDPALVNPSTLRSLQKVSDNLYSNLIDFRSNPTESAHLSNISTAVNGLLTECANLPLPLSLSDPEGLAEAAANYRKDMDTHVRELRQLADDLGGTLRAFDDKLTEMDAQVETQWQTVLAETESFKTELLAAETERREAFERELKDAQTTLGQAVETAKALVDAATADATRKTENLMGQTEEALKTSLQEMKTEAETGKKRIDELVLEAERATGYIGTATLAAGDQREADKQETVADRWRTYTVRAFLASIVLSSVLAEWTLHETSTARVALKLAVWLGLFGFVAYCGRQSAEHRRAAAWYRERENKLAAVDAYFAESPKEERAKQKESLASVFFGAKTEPPHAVETKEKSESSGVFALVPTTIKALGLDKKP